MYYKYDSSNYYGLPYVFFKKIFYKASSYVMLIINESPGAECMAESCPWVAAGGM